jgi:hypothetical protein
MEKLVIFLREKLVRMLLHPNLLKFQELKK